MKTPSPLSGVRFHLSGAIPADATEAQAEGIREFVGALTQRILAQGGVLVHGSHPSLVASIASPARSFVANGGSRDAIVLVRSSKFAGAEYQAEIDAHRAYSTVEIVPGDALLPMRTWMADRTDVVVAVGGKWWGTINARAGVPEELLASLACGKPGFLVTGFGGATAGFVREIPSILANLNNGLSAAQNRTLSTSTSPAQLAKRIVDQVQRLPLRRSSSASRRLFRVLALDGGGIRGAFTAAVLARWAELLGDEPDDLVRHFDLVAGTSTGAILAVGLGMGLAPRALLDFYRSEGPKIFDKRFYQATYDSKTLENALKSALGGADVPLSASRVRLVIPSVRATAGHAEVFTTPHAPEREVHRARTAVEVVLASAAAPSYFDVADVADTIAPQPYLDGGVWANNPTLAAIAEAVGPLGVPLERIDVLSVGTTSHELDFTKRHGGGKLKWATGVVDLFMTAQQTGTTAIAQRLLGRPRFLRIDSQTGHQIDLADVGATDDLIRRGSDTGHDSFHDVFHRFLDGQHATDWRDGRAP